MTGDTSRSIYDDACTIARSRRFGAAEQRDTVLRMLHGLHGKIGRGSQAFSVRMDDESVSIFLGWECIVTVCPTLHGWSLWSGSARIAQVTREDVLRDHLVHIIADAIV